MSSIGISLADSGISACLFNGEDTSLIPLESDAVQSPGYACLGDRGLLLGESAIRSYKLMPHRSTDSFWDQLSLRPAALPSRRKPISQAHLAYLHLKKIWQRVQSLEDDITSVGFALPGPLLGSDPQDEERLGILLGIIADIGIPISTLLPLEVAGLHYEAPDEAVDARLIYHLDVHQYQTYLYLLSGEQEVRATMLGKIPDCGFHSILDTLHSRLSQRFLHDTAFDVSEDFEVEQEFFLKVRDFLYKSQRSIREISVNFEDQVRSIQVAEDHIEQALQPTLERIGAMVFRAMQKNPQAGPEQPVTIQLTGRAVSIPGLENFLARHAPSPVHIISTEKGSASAGAAIVASRFKPATDLQHTPLYATWRRPRKPRGLDLSESAAASLRPTHLLFESVAYPLRSSAFIRDFPGNGSNIPEVLREAFRFPWSAEELTFEPDSSLPLELNERRVRMPFAIKTGDRLSVASRGRKVVLECIHCPDSPDVGTAT